VTALSLVVACAAIALGDDAPNPAVAAPPAPVTVEFLTDLPAAQAKAKADGKPLLVLVAPKWFASPEVARLDKDVLTGEECRKALDPFVRVRIAESEDREVHATHRVQFQGYPLALVLDADGTFLGSTSGLPAEDAAKTWPARVAAIPPRQRRMKELRAVLEKKPEDPQTLFDLALLHVENDEPDRAIALFDRMEAADGRAGDAAPTERVGEARFQVLRINAVRALADRRFADVEPLCQKWLRRFASHARAPDVLLIQANALYLAGDKDRAKEIWKGLVEKSAASDAGKRAKAALDGL
jgi:tetratricopeptide (TPR) repeat protein